MSSLKYRADIDGLRAVAVIAVVLFHGSLGLRGGYAGVDVFFVISGFLITKIIYDEASEQRFSFAHFYDRRIRRLFPALLVMLLATSAWTLYAMIPLDLIDYGRSLIAATVYVSNFEFYRTTDYFRPVVDLRPLVHTWSLAVEEQFYILAPICLSIIVRLFKKRWMHAACIAVAMVVSFAISVRLADSNPRAGFYLLPARAWELSVGALLSLGIDRLRPLLRLRPFAEVVAIAGIAAIIASFVIVQPRTPWPGWAATISVLGTMALIACGAVHPNLMVSRVLSLRPVVFVGKVSYSFYLWHWPLLVFLIYRTGEHPSTGLALVWVLASFVIACLSWRYVELPVRRRKILSSTRSLFVAALVGSIAAAGIGAAMVWATASRNFIPKSATPTLNGPGSRRNGVTVRP